MYHKRINNPYPIDATAPEHAHVIRSYRQIAEVLARHSSAPVTPTRARQWCREAERSLARALRSDPIIRAWLDSSSPLIRVTPQQLHR